MNFVGQTMTTMNNVESKTARIDVSTVSAGVYFVKVYDLRRCPHCEDHCNPLRISRKANL